MTKLIGWLALVALWFASTGCVCVTHDVYSGTIGDAEWGKHAGRIRRVTLVQDRVHIEAFVDDERLVHLTLGPTDPEWTQVDEPVPSSSGPVLVVAGHHGGGHVIEPDQPVWRPALDGTLPDRPSVASADELRQLPVLFLEGYSAFDLQTGVDAHLVMPSPARGTTSPPIRLGDNPRLSSARVLHRGEHFWISVAFSSRTYTWNGEGSIEEKDGYETGIAEVDNLPVKVVESFDQATPEQSLRAVLVEITKEPNPTLRVRLPPSVPCPAGWYRTPILWAPKGTGAKVVAVLTFAVAVPLTVALDVLISPITIPGWIYLTYFFHPVIKQH